MYDLIERTTERKNEQMNDWKEGRNEWINEQMSSRCCKGIFLLQQLIV